MAKFLKVFGRLVIILGGMTGIFFLTDFILLRLVGMEIGRTYWAIIITATALSGIILILLSSFISGFIAKLGGAMVNRATKMSLRDLVGGTIGLILGLIIAALLGSSVSSLKFGPYIVLVFSLFMGYVGLVIGLRRSEDILSIFTRSRSGKEKLVKASDQAPSILDTSVIIDGRIADIYRTGFIRGPLVVPNFVLDELKRVADSSDPLKKSRGRRGMDILNDLRHEDENAIVVTEQDYEDIKEVDIKLIRLALDMKGQVYTNDFNLNKMAQVQNVKVLNINDLANAVKTVVLPGEEMVVRVIREGKEADQGIAYLDDGTMVVVEGGRHYVGITLSVAVTSVLQTSAGRMIFAKPKE